MAIAILSIYAINFKWFYKLASRINLTKKYGGDVWNTVFEDSAVTWITVRPSKSYHSFQGEVLHYSDDSEKRELALNNVAIYDNETGNYEYT